MHIIDGFVWRYLYIDFIKKKKKTFTDGITNNNYSLKKLIFNGFFFIGQFVSNIITDKFTYKNRTSNKKLYWHSFR